MWIDTVVSTSFKYTLTYPKTKEKQKLPEIKKTNYNRFIKTSSV